MSRLFKFILIAFIAIFLFTTIIAGLYIYTDFRKQKMETQADKDFAEQSAICDTIPYITERPRLKMENFEADEIDTLKFRIIRDEKLIKDTFVCYDFRSVSQDSPYRWIEIPYDSFLKTDTILVTTKTKLHFKISGYHHYANLHYGMFGYLGHSDCRLSEHCTINGKEYLGAFLKKEEGLTTRYY